MEKVYGITQLNSEDMHAHIIVDETPFTFYYIGTDLKDIEDKIENNWTDLFETCYNFVALVSMDLHTINAVNDPIRIFEYQKKTGKYKEIAYYNMLIRSDDDRGIKYIKNEEDIK